MVHDPVKLMAQITVVVYSHDVEDERKQVDYSSVHIQQHIDLMGFNYEYQRKIKSQKEGWTINFQYTLLIKILLYNSHYVYFQ